jgi:hypothetical protein
MTAKNTAAKPNFVRTKISGVVLSLSSEGRTDIDDIVMLSPDLERALARWSRQPLADYSTENRETIIEDLAAEAINEFGLSPDRARFWAGLRFDR